MVLKRKLPSAMGESVAAPAAQSDLAPEKKVEKPEAPSQTPEPQIPSEPPKPKKDFLNDAPTPPPLAPEPELEPSSMDEAPVESDEMVMPVSEMSAAPVAPPSFGEDALEPSVTASAPVMESSSQEESSGGWQIDDLIAPEKSVSAAPELPQQPEKAAMEPASQAGMPPWQQNDSLSEPPILPGAGDEMDGGSKNKAVAGLLIMALLAVGAYYAFVERGDKTTERLARITNALEEVSEQPLEESPIQPEKVQGSQPQIVEVDVEEPVTGESVQPFTDYPTKEFEAVEVDISEEPSEEAIDAVMAQATTNPDQVASKAPAKQTVVEFIDVPEDEVDELITGEQAEEMPKEVTNFVDRWKDAVETAENKRQGKVVEEKDEDTGEVVEEIIDPYERAERNDEKLRNLEEELTAYRRILAGETADGPKKIAPLDFFNRTDKTSDGSIPEPARASDVAAQPAKDSQRAASMYGANPYNLPVVSEPEQKPLQKVRTLDDFDVTMFEPEKPRVRVPKNVHPTFKAHQFPELYLLSLLPGQGVVAQNRGRQGVLMLGESIEGWELVAVASQYAEFRKGKRRHVLTLNGVGELKF